MRLSPLRPGAAVRALFLLAPLGMAACGALGAAAPGQTLLAWRLVEVPAPGGKRLVLEQGPPFGDGRWSGIEVRLSRDHAGVGEEVEAEVWLPGAAGRHWVEVHPGRPGVRVLGPRAWIAEGDERVTARFTCGTPGPGGILVLVRE